MATAVTGLYSGSYVAFTARAGEVYKIAVDGYGGATGTIELTLAQATSTGTPPPATLAASIQRQCAGNFL